MYWFDLDYTHYISVFDLPLNGSRFYVFLNKYTQHK